MGMLGGMGRAVGIDGGGGSSEAGGLRCRLCACDAVGGGCCLACYSVNLGLLWKGYCVWRGLLEN